MTERYGDEGGQRPSGRGAVTERLARSGQGAHEIDLTDEAGGRDRDDDDAGRPGPDRDERASSGAFEPAERAAPTADPPAEATRQGSTSIFDVGERAKQEDLEPTGYEPPLSDADPATPRGETTVTEPGEPTAITPTPVPAADPPAGATAGPGLPEPGGGAEPPAAPGQAGPSALLLGSLDADEIRNRFLDIQAGFVDEPRQAVEEAGRFVDGLVQQVVDALQAQRGQVAGPAPEGSTEDLRLALRAYRQFVDRLLGLAG
jgi:hypothetical protein